MSPRSLCSALQVLQTPISCWWPNTCTCFALLADLPLGPYTPVAPQQKNLLFSTVIWRILGRKFGVEPQVSAPHARGYQRNCLLILSRPSVDTSCSEIREHLRFRHSAEEKLSQNLHSRNNRECEVWGLAWDWVRVRMREEWQEENRFEISIHLVYAAQPCIAQLSLEPPMLLADSRNEWRSIKKKKSAHGALMSEGSLAQRV
ncbi:hypothetical protein B0H13DRAFT_1893413 [Mycena leptocephala]|nr:hypothetical protein B0H13DRAFT_1895042 [Mycena leptocephala]KAJ7877031.1 hypothetical protein B0H13DRAFT_1893413 [Mycena leptocephala]